MQCNPQLFNVIHREHVHRSVFVCRALSLPILYYRRNKKISVAAQSLTFLSTQAFGLSRANELVLYVCKVPYTYVSAPVSTEQGWYIMLELELHH